MEEPMHDERFKYLAEQEIGKALLAGGNYTIIYKCFDASSVLTKTISQKWLMARGSINESRSGIPIEECEKISENWMKSYLVTCCMHLLRGLAHLHSLGIWHGDVTPECLYLSSDRLRLKLGDYDHIKQIREGLVKSNCIGQTLTEKEINNDVRMAAYTLYVMLAKSWQFAPVKRNSVPFKEGLEYKFRADCPENPLRKAWRFDLYLGCYQNLDFRLGDYLIRYMLSEKPSAQNALKHPFFWSENKIDQFLSHLCGKSVISDINAQGKNVTSLSSGEKEKLRNELDNLHFSVTHNLELSNRVTFPGVMNTLLNQLPDEKLFKVDIQDDCYDSDDY